MILNRRLVFLSLAVLVWCSGASADDRNRNESVYREYRAAKRQQVGDLCDIWFASWRPQTVGKTYHALACQYARIDLSGCSPSLRRHINKAERTCTEISELFGQGTMPDIGEVLSIVSGAESSPSVSSERGRRVLELMRELSASEEVIIQELGLDE